MMDLMGFISIKDLDKVIEFICKYPIGTILLIFSVGFGVGFWFTAKCWFKRQIEIIEIKDGPIGQLQQEIREKDNQLSIKDGTIDQLEQKIREKDKKIENLNEQINLDGFKELTKIPKNIAIYLTSDLGKNETLKKQITQTLETCSPNLDIYIKSSDEFFTAFAPAFYKSLKKGMDKYDAYIGIMGQSLDRPIAYTGKTIFEMVYECAFFKGLPSCLLIPSKMKISIQNPRTTKQKRISVICHLQQLVYPQGRNHYFYDENFELIDRLQDGFHNLIFPTMPVIQSKIKPQT